MSASHSVTSTRLLELQEATFIFIRFMRRRRVLVLSVLRRMLPFYFFVPWHGKVVSLIQLRGTLEVFHNRFNTWLLPSAGQVRGEVRI